MKVCPRYYKRDFKKETIVVIDNETTVLTITDYVSMECNEECALYEFRPNCGPT